MIVKIKSWVTNCSWILAQNFSVESTCEITAKLLRQFYVCTRWRQGFKIARMKMLGHLKTIRSTGLNTGKSTNFINKDSSGYFSKKFGKFWIFNVCFKLFSTWSFRYEQVKTHDKRYCLPWHKKVIHWWNQEMISPAFCQNPYNFTRHHFFTHTNIIICHNAKENCFGRLTSRSCGLMSCIKPR